MTQKPTNINPRLVSRKNLIIGTLLCTFLCFVNCDQSADKWVSETVPNNNFTVDYLTEEVFENESSVKETVVTVHGFVEDINFLNNRNTVILRGEIDLKNSVICDMQKGQTEFLSTLKIGQLVTVKGILKGSLKDIILLNCLISNQTTND